MGLATATGVVVIVAVTIATATSVATKRRPMTGVAVVVGASTAMAGRAHRGGIIIHRMRRRHICCGRRIGRVRRGSIRRRVRGAICLSRIGGWRGRLRRRATESHSNGRSHHLALWSRTVTVRASSTTAAVAVGCLRVRLMMIGPRGRRRVSLRSGSRISRPVRRLRRG